MLILYFEIDDITITAHKLCGPAIVLELNLQKKKRKKKKEKSPQNSIIILKTLFLKWSTW